MISRSSFIPVNVWNMSKCDAPWSRSTSTLSLKNVPFRQRLFLILPFPFLGRIGFFFFVLSSSCGTLPFFWIVLFSSDGALAFSFFVLSLIIELCFHFLVFLGKVTVRGGVDLDDWSDICLVATAAGDWSAVRWVAAAADWLAVHWLTGKGDWLEMRWVAGEGDWLEMR